jgi:hypothetical protein
MPLSEKPTVDISVILTRLAAASLRHMFLIWFFTMSTIDKDRNSEVTVYSKGNITGMSLGQTEISADVQMYACDQRFTTLNELVVEVLRRAQRKNGEKDAFSKA